MYFHHASPCPLQAPERGRSNRHSSIPLLMSVTFAIPPGSLKPEKWIATIDSHEITREGGTDVTWETSMTTEAGSRSDHRRCGCRGSSGGRRSRTGSHTTINLRGEVLNNSNKTEHHIMSKPRNSFEFHSDCLHSPLTDPALR